MSIIIGGPGGEPGSSNTVPNLDDIANVFTIDGGWLVLLFDTTLFTTDDETDFECFAGPIEPLPEPIEVELPPPTTSAIGGDINNAPVGVVVIS